MHTSPSPARGDRSLYGLVRVAAPVVLAVGTVAAAVLWLSTGGDIPGAGASPVTLSSHDGVVAAARAGRKDARAFRPSAKTAARGPREVAHHERPAAASNRTTRPSRPRPGPGSPSHGPKPAPSPKPSPPAPQPPQQDAAPPPPPPPPPPAG